MEGQIFNFDRIETRGIKSDTRYPRYVIRGYAAAADEPHIYQWSKNREGRVINSMKSLFTQKAIESINEQLKYKKVFVDAVHEIAANFNSKNILEELKKQATPEATEQIALLEANLKMKQLPLMKVRKFDVLDKGLYVELETNPYFAEVDEEHEKYYKAITGSLVEGYLNGMSLNFKTKDVTNEDGIDKINDVDVFGISVLDNASLGSNTAITEVAMRGIKDIIESRSEKKMEEPKTEIDPEQINKLVQEQVANAIKARDIEEQKRQQEAEYKRMQEELESYKRKTEELEKAQAIGKGRVPDIKITDKATLSQEELMTKIKDLTIDEAILLQADPEVGRILPKLVKVQERPPSKSAWYQTITKFKPLEPEALALHNALIRKEEQDVIIK